MNRRTRGSSANRNKLKRWLAHRDGSWACRYCQLELNLDGTVATNLSYATLDHVLALADGGTWHVDNLVLSCQPCNIKKGSSKSHKYGEGTAKMIKVVTTDPYHLALYRKLHQIGIDGTGLPNQIMLVMITTYRRFRKAKKALRMVAKLFGEQATIIELRTREIERMVQNAKQVQI